MSKSTQHVRGTPEKNRKGEFNGEFPFAGGLNVEEPGAAEMYLARFNAGLADVETGLLKAGLTPGMAGYEDSVSGQTGYGIPSPGLDPAPAGMFVKKA